MRLDALPSPSNHGNRTQINCLSVARLTIAPKTGSIAEMASIGSIAGSSSIAIWLAAGWLVACGGKSNSSTTCETGALRCGCYRNQTCDSGLACMSGVCVVDPAAAGGARNDQSSLAPGGTQATNTFALGGKSAQPATSILLGGSSATSPATGGANGGTFVSTGGGAIHAAGGAIAAGGTGNIGVAVGGASGTSVDGACPYLLNTLSPENWARCSYLPIAPNNVLILVDKSGSMTSTPTGDTQTKWAGVTNALKTLRTNDSRIQWGLMLFPYLSTGSVMSCEMESGAEAVVVPIGPAQVTVAQINAKLAQTTPAGGTPTAAALDAAVLYFTEGAGSALVGAKYVVLITDGGPNCNSQVSCGPDTCTANLDKTSSCGTGVANCCDVANTITGRPDPRSMCLDDGSVRGQIAYLRSIGIITFVVGIPGTEVYASYLNEFAVAGGAPVSDPNSLTKYYAASSAANLGAALNQITTSLTRSCTVALESAPKDLLNLNLALDCMPLPYRAGDIQNWHYSSDLLAPAIVIDGQACQRIAATGVGRADVVVGCPPFNVL